MSETGKIPRHLEYLLAFTAFAAGTVDIISFAKLGGIFASAMTGNLAFLGLYAARGAVTAAVGSFLALVGFVLGGAAGTLLARQCGRDAALRLLLGAEVALVALFLLLWFVLPHRLGGPGIDLLILLLSVAMGMQSIAGKKINLSNIPTVVFTSTLTNIVIGLTETLASGQFRLPKDTGRQLVSFLSYFSGALVAGFFVFMGWQLLFALPLIALGAALAVQLADMRTRAAQVPPVSAG